MHFIVQFTDQQNALDFVKLMKKQHIELIIYEHDNQFQLYLKSDNQKIIDFVHQQLEHFLINPKKLERQRDGWDEFNQQDKFNSQTAHLQNKLPLLPVIQKSGIITMCITLLSIIGYLAMLWLPDQTFELLHYPNTDQFSTEIWRYISPIFMHFTITHVAFNLALWWYLAGMIELKLGRIKLIELVIISAILSNIAQYHTSTIYFGGLSGVVYCLMGYCWLLGILKPSLCVKFYGSMIIFALIWILFGFSGVITGLGNIAHLIGLIVGLFAAIKDGLPAKKVSPKH